MGRTWARAREFFLVSSGFAALTAFLTYPLAFNLQTLGYKLHVTGDPQYSVWNVAWVAHALLTDPRHVLDANIFYPQRSTLIYSETNLLAGLIGLPAYWLTGSAYAAHNFVVLASFTLSGVGMYYLIHYLLRHRLAAIVAGIIFAYSPYAFSHLSHIQLLMTAGIPFTFLAFHRVVDRPSVRRGIALGVTMALQGFACAYYSVFLALVVPLLTVITMTVERLWRSRAHLVALSAAAISALVTVSPLVMLYLQLQRTTGFGRPLADSARYAATWSSYFTSAAYAARWLHPHLPPWTDVLFPGFVAIGLGPAALWLVRREPTRVRRLAWIYAAIAAFAVWQSLGPDAWLYAATYRLVPALTFLRAPSRFGVLVVFALAVLSAITVATLSLRRWQTRVAAAILLVAVVADHAVPVPWTPPPLFNEAYRLLADQPPGGVLELPVYSRGANYNRTKYMIASTVHWKPLVNAYSDYIPPSFSERRDRLATFPSRDAFSALDGMQVRYAVFHLADYRQNPTLEQWLSEALREFAPRLELLHVDDDVALYRIVQHPAALARVAN